MSVNVEIVVDQAVTSTSNYVYIVVIEDDVHNHDNIARMVLDPIAFDLTTPGEDVSINRAFSLDPTWKEDDIEIVVFVQPIVGNRTVLQATKPCPTTWAPSPSPPILRVSRPAGPSSAPAAIPWSESTVVSWRSSRGRLHPDWGDVEEWTSPAPTSVSGTMIQDGSLTSRASTATGPSPPT